MDVRYKFVPLPPYLDLRSPPGIPKMEHLTGIWPEEKLLSACDRLGRQAALT